MSGRSSESEADGPDFSFLDTDAQPAGEDFSGLEDAVGDAPAMEPGDVQDVDAAADSIDVEGLAESAAAKVEESEPEESAEVSSAVASAASAESAESDTIAKSDDSARGDTAGDAVKSKLQNKAASQRAAGAVGSTAEFKESGGGGARAGKSFSIVAGYAAAITLFLVWLLVTGRISLSAVHPLESLPDIRPLQENEFQHVPADSDLPEGHTLSLGDTVRFGDVLVTAVKVTREPTEFTNILSDKPAPEKTTRPLLRLWLRFENAAEDVAFQPWEVGLMSSRTPPHGTDEETVSNSWLEVMQGEDKSQRTLNLLHVPESSFDISGMQSGMLVKPGEAVESFVVASEEAELIPQAEVTGYRWRVQFRKGVNRESGQGVTTLIDVRFGNDDVTAG